MSGFELTLTTEALDRLSLAQIRYMLEEINHSIVHLERSQEALLDAIEETADEELAEAYWENIEVLVKKKRYVERITQYLEENDMAFARHNVLPEQTHTDNATNEPVQQTNDNEDQAVTDYVQNTEEEQIEDFSVAALSVSITASQNQDSNGGDLSSTAPEEGLYL